MKAMTYVRVKLSRYGCKPIYLTLPSWDVSAPGLVAVQERAEAMIVQPGPSTRYRATEAVVLGTPEAEVVKR